MIRERLSKRGTPGVIRERLPKWESPGVIYRRDFQSGDSWHGVIRERLSKRGTPGVIRERLPKWESPGVIYGREIQSGERPQVAKAKSECMVIELTTSCKYKTLYGKL